MGYPTADAFHGVLTAATVSSATLTADHITVEVINVDGAGSIYYTLDGSTPVVPSGGATNTFCLPAIGSRIHSTHGLGIVTAKLISSGTPAWHVTGTDF